VKKEVVLYFHRYPRNPILKPRDWPYKVNSVMNPAAVRFDNQTIMVARVEDMRGLSHFSLARSDDGVSDWRIDAEPFMSADTKNFPEEEWGLEDPRIMFVEAEKKFFIAYTAFSPVGPQISLATTEDFKSVTRLGTILPPTDKNACVFPEKINGRWAILHRPYHSGTNGCQIWISFSDDFKRWGDDKVVLRTRGGAWWDSQRIGLGPNMIKTEQGWLVFYHGVKTAVYRTGVVLLDLENPTKVLHRSPTWIFSPEELYERVGDVPNVVFPCGVIWNKDTDAVHLYYGAADTTICLATAKMGELMEYVLGCPGEG